MIMGAPAAILLAAAIQAAGAPAISVGEDRAVTFAGNASPAPLVEPYLSVDPSDGKHLLAGVIVISKPDISATDCATLVSFDGGAAWQRRDLGLTDCADPWTAFLPDGTAILAVLGREGVLVYRSSDGGRTWAGCADSPGNGDAGYRWPGGGDYHGLAERPDGRFQLLWADSRDGTYRLRTADVSVAGRVSAGNEKP